MRQRRRSRREWYICPEGQGEPSSRVGSRAAGDLSGLESLGSLGFSFPDAPDPGPPLAIPARAEVIDDMAAAMPSKVPRIPELLEDFARFRAAEAARAAGITEDAEDSASDAADVEAARLGDLRDDLCESRLFTAAWWSGSLRPLSLVERALLPRLLFLSEPSFLPRLDSFLSRLMSFLSRLSRRPRRRR